MKLIETNTHKILYNLIVKTNAMRMLDRAKIPYETLEYEIEKDKFSGEAVSDLLGLEYESCYKTLGAISGHDVFLFVIPVSSQLDLKKAAKAAGVKSLEMIHVKDLKKLVGYERGSVSPIGANRNKGIFIHEICLTQETMEISGGEFGIGLLINREKLLDFLKAKTADLTREDV